MRVLVMCRWAAAAVLAFTSLPALWAQGTSGNKVGWFNGDYRESMSASVDWYLSPQAFHRTFDDFNVPAGGWTVTGLFAYHNLSVKGITQASWEIRSGVSAGNPGVLVASGLSSATQTMLDAYPDGTQNFLIAVTGLSVSLQPGTYWLSLTPAGTASQQSWLLPTLGANATGSPAGNDGQAYIYAPGDTFKPQTVSGDAGSSGDFSMGVFISGPASAPPVILGLANAASYAAGPIAPGEIVTITGTNLGPPASAGMTLDLTGKAATTLGGVQVLFGPWSAPLLYVSANQINAVVPYEAGQVTNAAVQVRFGSQISNLFPLTVAQTAPAIFTADGSGAGQAAALNGDNSYNSAAIPAAPGGVVVLFVTGEGQTSPAGVTGKVTPLSATAPLTPQPLASVTATIAGLSAKVLFAGEEPFAVSGVMQVNLLVPANAPSGNQPVAVTVGSTATQTGVTVAVK
jgi:uncharacterized protein (TIGR03437 family)